MMLKQRGDAINGRLCWDCLYFKTREYKRLDADLRRYFVSDAKKLLIELKKARRENRPARYWRCQLYQTKIELYTLERTARSLRACRKFEDMR